MGKKTKSKPKRQKHFSNPPHFVGLSEENLPEGKGFIPQDRKLSHRPNLRRTTTK